MKSIIFSAGIGTRLRPLTDKMPKALVPVGDVPMLERVIGQLKSAGITEFVVNVHHFAPQIEQFLKENSNFGVKIDISREMSEPLETGGGIKKAEPWLSDSLFLLHNVDMFHNLDLKPFMEEAQKQISGEEKALAMLLVTDPKDSGRHLYFDEKMCLHGWMDTRTQSKKSPYPNFDPSLYQGFAFCGIHIISPEIFPLMSSWPEKFSIIDFYLSVADKFRIKAFYLPELKIIDIGSLEKLREANEMLLAST